MKRIIALSIIISILLTSFATARSERTFNPQDFLMEALKEQKIEGYLDSNWDFMGRRGEKLYFELRDEYSKGNVLKTIEFDFKNVKNQYKMTVKAYDDNSIIYTGIGIIAGGFTLANVQSMSAKRKIALNSRLIRKLLRIF